MSEVVTEELLASLRMLADDVHNHVDSLRRKIAKMESDRANVAAMLRFQEEVVHGPDYLPHLSVRRIFKPRELRDYCLDGLRRSEGMLDTRELARLCMAKRGLDSEDILVRKKVVFSIIQTMKTARRSGMVETCGKRKGVLLWRLRQPAVVPERSARRRGGAPWCERSRSWHC